MDTDYLTRVNALLLRTRQLKRGILDIHKNHVNNLVETGRNDVIESLVDFVRQLETIETNAKPKVVGLAGNVSAGKSSFINEILKAKVVSVDDGSTTAVPTEISFIPGNEYRATVHFVSIEDIKKDLKNLCAGIPPIGQPNNDTPAHTSLKNKLARFFNFGGPPLEVPHPSTDVDLEALNAEGQLFGWIGAAPQVFTSSKIPHLLKQIERFIRFDESLTGINRLLPHLVNRVCIEGPFDIPPGVVLIDTPGLNDSERVNSQRSYNAISSFDELWFLTDTNTLLANETDQTFLSRALITEGRPVQIVSTKIDGKKRSDTDLDRYRTKIRGNLRKVFIAHLRGVVLNQASLVTMTPEEETEVNLRLEGIGIEFTGIPPAEYLVPTIGFDYWRGRIADFGLERAANLRALEDSLTGLERAMRALGTVQPNFVVPVGNLEGWRQYARNAIQQLRNALSLVVYSHNFPWGAATRGNWRRVWQWNQFEAIMSPAYGRRGSYRSTALGGSIDVNEDIQNEWINATRHIRHDLPIIFRDLSTELQRIVNDWVDVPQVAKQLLDFELRILCDNFNAVVNNCFLGNTAERVRNYFTRSGTYFYHRRSLPSNAEISNVIQNVIGSDAFAGLNAIVAATDNTTRQFLALGNPVSNLPYALRRALDDLLDAVPVPPPAGGPPLMLVPDIHDIQCSISLDIFVDPVQTVCGHVFDRAAIEFVINGPSTCVCPVCRANLNGTWLVPRHDIVAKINLYRQYQAYLAAEGEPVQLDPWWITFWRECCNEYREGLAAEALAHSPPVPPDQD